MATSVLRISLSEVDKVRVTVPDGSTTEIPVDKIDEQYATILGTALDADVDRARNAAKSLANAFKAIRELKEFSYELCVPLKLAGFVPVKDESK